MKNIICKNCASKKLKKIGIPFGVYGDADLRVSNTLTTYACGECGHIEWFDSHYVDEYSQNKTAVQTLTDELERLEKRLFELMDPINSLISSIKSKIGEAKLQLESLDITIRQQQELQEKVRSLESQLRDIKIPREKYDLEKQIKEIEKKLSHAIEIVKSYE